MKRLIALIVLAFVLPLEASTMRLLTLEQLTAAADKIVVATIQGNQYQWANERADMWTVTRVRITEKIKWSGPQAGELQLRHPGGIGKMNDGKTWNIHVPGVPAFKGGKKAMLFLQQRGNYHELIGWAQGYFRVETNAAGQEVVFRDMEGIEFVNTDATPVPDEMTLNRLVATVRRMAR